MKKSIATVLILISFGAGVAAGISGAPWWSGDRVGQAQASVAGAALLSDTEALVRLRGNDVPGALSMLEVAVNMNVLVIGGLPESARAEEDIRRVLRRTADYRAKYPHKASYPEIDADVAKVLSEATRGKK
jgi:hypothetical protein